MITSILSNELAQAFAWTLIHSIWQFTLVAILLTLTLKALYKSKSTYRYFIGFGALGICLLMALMTFAIYYMDSLGASSGLDIQTQYQTFVASSTTGFSLAKLLTLIDPYLLAIVNAWLIGSILFFIKFTTGYFYLNSIIKKATSNKALNKSLKKIKSKYKINRDVIIKESINITTPIVMGIVKPVILFPLGLVNQLSLHEVNAILAHELAHIKRHDYLFNILQIVVETLFYFHPAIWYISSNIRNERENCCDDLAITHVENNVSYAKTLIKLQELNITEIQPAMGFSGSKNTFSNRILRILDQPTSQSSHKDKFLVALLLFTTLFVTAENYQGHERNIDDNFEVYVIDDCPRSPEDIKYYLDTIPERNTFHIKKRSDKRDIELVMEDGEIKSLKINGDSIPQNDLSKHENILEELIPDTNKDIITLFPECGDFGKVYLLEKLSRNAVNMDSVLDLLKENYSGFPQWGNENEWQFNFEDYDNIMIDTIKDSIKYFSFENNHFEENDKIIIDSIWDLFPHKLPQWSNDNNSLFNNEFPERIKELFQGQNGNINLEDFRLRQDDIFSDDNKFPEWVFENEKFPEELFEMRNDLFLEKNKLKDLFQRPQGETVANIISKKLLSDELIDDNGDTKVELTGKFMKINGEKQPSNIWKKYKRVYESNTGLELTKESKLVINISKETKEKINSKSLFGI